LDSRFTVTVNPSDTVEDLNEAVWNKLKKNFNFQRSGQLQFYKPNEPIYTNSEAEFNTKISELNFGERTTSVTKLDLLSTVKECDLCEVKGRLNIIVLLQPDGKLSILSENYHFYY
jgi:hypothetical protein